MNEEAPDSIVGVHVGDPLLELWIEFAPFGNHIAFLLLHRMLELALLSEVLTREDCCGATGGALNDCTFIALVSDPVAAVETIKRELGRIGLLPHSQIGISEGPGWRCVYPGSNIRMGYQMDSERLEHASEQSLRAQGQQVDAILATWNRLMLKRGQQGDAK